MNNKNISQFLLKWKTSIMSSAHGPIFYFTCQKMELTNRTGIFDVVIKTMELPVLIYSSRMQYKALRT